jgi:hypothetical protein
MREIVGLDEAAACEMSVRRVLEAPVRPQRHVFAVDRAGVAQSAKLPGKAPRRHRDLRAVREADAAGGLQEEPVELVAEQEIAQVAPGVGEVFGVRQEEVHHADRLVGPVPHLAAAQHDVPAAPLRELEHRGDGVLRAAAVPPDRLHPLGRHRQQIALRAR